MGLFKRREIRLLNERIALLVDGCNSLRRANALLEGNITKLKRDNQLADDKIIKLIASQKDFDMRVNSAVLRKLDDFTQQALDNLHFSDKPYFKSLADNLSEPRQIVALSELLSFHVLALSVTAEVVSSSGSVYKTTLTDCTCEDFHFRKKPCKHMYCLALTLGLAHKLPLDDMFDLLRDYASKRAELDKKELQANRRLKEWERIKKDAQQSAPYLAGLWADHEALLSAREESALREKKPPAEKAADKIKAIGERLRAAVKLNKLLTYQLNYYESVFPWLLDFKKLDPDDAYKYSRKNDDERDNSSLYISKSERKNLDIYERWQLALERYKKRSRTDWEAGIDYERFVCFEYEKQGYKVVSNGVLAGLEDMGRDLICFRGNEVLIIQCKRWREERTIHEKHIFQLYGSAITYSIEHPDKDVHAVFVTSAVLSDLARRCAERLEIQVIENHPLKDYPMIKCNLSRDGTKIFHMPYDQQYNRVQIDYSAGEFYAETVNEALEQGFRRAFRHRAET